MPSLPHDQRPLQHVLATIAAIQTPQVQVHTQLRFTSFDNFVSARCGQCKRMQTVRSQVRSSLLPPLSSSAPPSLLIF
jgi:hypothetical protein